MRNCNCYSFYSICNRSLVIKFLVLSSVYLQLLIYCHIYITEIKDCVIYTIAGKFHSLTVISNSEDCTANNHEERKILQNILTGKNSE